MRSIIAIIAVVMLAIAGTVLWAWGQPDTKLPTSFASAFNAPENYEFEPPAPGSYTLNKIKTAPSGRVLDIEGESRDLTQLLDGKYNLVSFVYLNCGDVDGCPLAMSVLFDIYETSIDVPELREHVQLVTLSFDPQRDTIEAIKSFAYPMSTDKNADKKLNWEVLTTENKTALAPILKGYGQAIDQAKDQEVINHLLRMYLVDRDGFIRNVYGLGFLDPRLLMSDIETLIMQERGA